MGSIDVDAGLLERGHVRAERNGSVLRVSLERPEARNAQTPSTWEALAAVGHFVRKHEASLTAVVLGGAGPSFSAGLDRRMFTPEGIPGEMSLMSLAQQDDAGIDASIARIQDAFTWWREVTPVTIAAVQGHAIGAGFQLALACDILLASPDAQFAMRETSYGIVPDLAGTWPLVRSVGYSRALEICATGRSVSADEGYRLGFVTRIVDDLPGGVDGMVQALSATMPGAVAALKPLLRDAQVRTPQEQASAERAAQARRLRGLLSGG